MTRSLASDHGVKRQTIMENAAALFARAGFESARLQDLATACGTSKSNLYHYFPRKEDLLHAIISEHIASTAGELDEIANGEGTAKERLVRFVRAFVQRAADKRNEHLVLTNDLKFLSELQQQEIRLVQAQAVDLLVELLNEINPRIMRSKRVRASYALLLFGTMIWTFTWYSKEGGMTPQELADRLADVFLHGFEDADHPPAYR
ncbi:TetR/AcrR family transcriptional regulator [Ramlibacter tataouinensis]|uniref:TetR/AcrR family transcriptional regulator n=1 Tax=Ramlibacter tataouinensis TaxID=94132 RepID=UPI0022F3EB07|nr:TetR/AcrR family transcriptional regulator [Ramlibacter tataouinensis]WBY03078.1 TetR/AcrR family transcriptional regulator [Ramlibacter tataouinensis]